MKQKLYFLNKFAAFALIFAICAPVFAVSTDSKSGRKSLTEDQKILHVLNRLGFGARPGDVEKVKATGIKKYIDQQLDGVSIADPVAESRVQRLEIFNMTTAEVFAKYPNPGALLRQLEGTKRNRQAAAQKETPKMGEEFEDAKKDQQRERREKLQGLYEEYDLKPAAQLVPQIAANRVLRAVYSERQLQEVMVDFWQNHFNVFSGKNAVRWYIPSYERDVLRKNALGNFKDLVVGTAQHPAMLFFLDNFESVSPKTQANNRGNNNRLQRRLQNGNLTPQMRERIKERQGLTDEQLDQRIKQMAGNNPQQNQKKRQRGINENYARELMELHTLGVDGEYTQKDIVEVAKAFTGWTIADARGYRRSAAAAIIQGNEDQRLARLQRQQGVPEDTESGEFYFNERFHDKDAKTVLGQKVNEGGINDGLKVIDILVKQPATAKFIARKLAVKFVSDNPGDALVGRIAEAFSKSNGDIKITLKAIFNDKEFFAPENYRAKIKTPFELAISSIRTLGADTNASPGLLAMLNKLGEVPYGYQAPTGYPDTAEDWVNTGALLERLNFAVAIASNRIPGTKVNLKSYEGESKTKVLDHAIAEILDGDISAGTKATLLKQIEQPLPDVKAGNDIDDMQAETTNMAGPGKRGNRQARLLQPSGNPDVFKVVSLVLGTPEFQRQ
ncbi:MAG: DUF1800 domain-containing protein [Pyrinomonadaceae bacterium]